MIASLISSFDQTGEMLSDMLSVSNFCSLVNVEHWIIIHRQQNNAICYVFSDSFKLLSNQCVQFKIIHMYINRYNK